MIIVLLLYGNVILACIIKYYIGYLSVLLLLLLLLEIKLIGFWTFKQNNNLNYWS